MKTKIILILLVLTSLVWNLLLYTKEDNQSIYNLSFNLMYGSIYLLGSVIAFGNFNKKNLSLSLKKSFLYYALSLGSYTIAMIIWSYYNLVSKVEIPYPGPSDVFFLLFIPFSALGFIYLIKSLGHNYSLRNMIETLFLTLIFFLVLYTFIGQNSQDLDVPVLTRILNLTYPLLDSFIVALTIVGIRTNIDTLQPNLFVFSFAALFAALGDTLFTLRSAQGLYWNGDIADTLYLISGSLFTLGIINMAKSESNRKTI